MLSWKCIKRHSLDTKIKFTNPVSHKYLPTLVPLHVVKLNGVGRSTFNIETIVGSLRSIYSKQIYVL